MRTVNTLAFNLFDTVSILYQITFAHVNEYNISGREITTGIISQRLLVTSVVYTPALNHEQVIVNRITFDFLCFIPDC